MTHLTGRAIPIALLAGWLPGCGGRSELLAAETLAAVNDASVPAGDGSPPGDAGGRDSGARADAAATPSCTLSRARVFVTSAMYDANLGGVSGADAHCLARARAGGLGGRWRAWLSDASHPAPAHIYAAPSGYVLLDGSIVAKNLSGLLSGSLAHAIDRTELNTPVSDGNTEVWTGTSATGNGNAGYCADGSGYDWASNNRGATITLVGHENATDRTWTEAYLQFCNRTNVRLYCFEVCN